MKIKITAKLIRKRNGDVLDTYEHIYDDYKSALDYILQIHEDCNTYEATFIKFEKEIINEKVN